MGRVAAAQAPAGAPAMTEEMLRRSEIGKRLGIGESKLRFWSEQSPAFLVGVKGEDGAIRYSLPRYALVAELRARKLTTREINAELSRRFPLDVGAVPDDQDDEQPAQAALLAPGGPQGLAEGLQTLAQLQGDVAALSDAVRALAAVMQAEAERRALPPAKPEPPRYSVRWWWRRIVG